MKIFSDSALLQFEISLISNLINLTREKISNVLNYGSKKCGEIFSSLYQISQNDQKHPSRRISSDNRSLIRKSNNSSRENKTSKVLHTSISEYWKDALFNHWFILIQCLILVTIIIMVAPWIGTECNSETSFGENYFDHRPDLHLNKFRRSGEERTNLPSQKQSSFFTFFSSGKDRDNSKKRSGILRRKRIYKRFY